MCRMNIKESLNITKILYENAITCNDKFKSFKSLLRGKILINLGYLRMTCTFLRKVLLIPLFIHVFHTSLDFHTRSDFHTKKILNSFQRLRKNQGSHYPMGNSGKKLHLCENQGMFRENSLNDTGSIDKHLIKILLLGKC